MLSRRQQGPASHMFVNLVRRLVAEVWDVLPELPEGWTHVDIIKTCFGLLLLIAASLSFSALLPNRKPRYVGERDKKGRPHGRGKLTNLNGDTYEGEFVDGKPSGSGVYTFRKNDCQYRGQFKHGAYHGQGIETYENHSKYEGYFEHGLRHGVGRMSFPDGSWYYGQWASGKRSGKGVQFDKTENARFEGEFKAGLRHGKGVLRARHGDKVAGVWEHGQLVRDRSKAHDTLSEQASEKHAAAVSGVDDDDISAADKRMTDEMRSVQDALANADRAANEARNLAARSQ